MKHLSIKQLLAISTLAIALPFSALSHAEPGKHYGAHDNMRGHGFEHGGHRGEPGIPPHLYALNLTQDQQDKIFAIKHEQAPAKYAQHIQHRETMEAIHALGKADIFDEARAQQLTDQLARIEKDKAMSRLKTEARITALLTPEQRALAREFDVPRHQGPGHHGFNKRGPGQYEPTRYRNHPAPR